VTNVIDGKRLSPTPSNIKRVRENIDPDSIWFSDEELRRIVEISGCQLNKIIVRCYLGIEQKARTKGDMASVRDARNQLSRYEVGFTQFI
jgi:hypothetical protein